MAPTVSDKYSPRQEERGDDNSDDTTYHPIDYNLTHAKHRSGSWESIVSIPKDDVTFVVLAAIRRFGFYEEVAYLISIARHIFQTMSHDAASPVLISTVRQYVRILATNVTREFVEYYQRTPASELRGKRLSDCILLREYDFFNKEERHQFVLDIYAILRLGARLD